MENKTIIIIGLGVLAFYLMSRQPARQYPPQPVGVVPGSPHWSLWVSQVLQAAGGLTRDLFGPGGPFAGQNQAAITQAAQSGGFTVQV